MAPTELEMNKKSKLSVVVARTKEGKTLLRRIESCDIEFIDEEMPLGALAWQERHKQIGLPDPVPVWCFIVDGGNFYVPVTLRHKDFALALDSQKIKNSVRNVGDIVFYYQFRICSLVPRITSSHVYIVPRELVSKEVQEKFPSVPWFIVEDQAAGDSRRNTPKPKDISSFLYNPTTKLIYALCGDRTNMLLTMNGATRCEKNAKLEIGKWYSAQYNPAIATVLTSIHQYNNVSPLQMHVQKYTLNDSDETLILIRDVIKLPLEEWDERVKLFQLVTKHPLLSSIRFPQYCSFSNTGHIEVCFARRTFRRKDLTRCWEVVAVSNGIYSDDGKSELYWLPKLMGDMEEIIPLVKHAFPFIKSLRGLEEMHYAQVFGSSTSYEEVTSTRIKAFTDYQATKENEPAQPIFGSKKKLTMQTIYEMDDALDD